MDMSININTKNIIGVWSLQSFVITDENNLSKNWGDNVHGTLIYTESGHMSISINRQLVSTDNEFKDIYDAILSYAGIYQINGDKIIHTVTESSNPARIGQDQVRHAKLDNGHLVLSSGKESFGVARLVWAKLK